MISNHLICPKCKNQNSYNANYCINCGESLQNNSSSYRANDHNEDEFNNQFLSNKLLTHTSLLQAEKPIKIHYCKYCEEIQQYYFNLFQSMNIGVCLCELVRDQQQNIIDWKILEVNKMYETITGIPREKALGQNASKLYTTEAPEYLDTFSEVLLTGEPAHFEAYFSPLNQYTDNTVFPISDNQFIILFSDITDCKTLEYQLELKNKTLKIKEKELNETLQQIHISEKKYYDLFTNINEGFALHELIYDENGEPEDYKIIEVNPAYETITGISKEEAINQKASRLYSYDNTVPFLDIYSKVVSTGEPIYYEVFFPPMNKHFRVSAFSPGKNQFATVFNDISTQKLFELEVKRQNEELHQLHIFVDSSVLPTFMLDQSMKLVYVNQAACQILNYTANEFTQKSLFEISPDLTKDKWQNASQTLKKQNHSIFETTLKKKTGEIVPVELRINYFKSELSRCYFIYAVDLTMHKQVEKLLEEQKQSLELKIEAQSQKLLTQQINLEEQNKNLLEIKKELEKTLSYTRASEKRFYNLFNNMNEGVSINKLLFNEDGEAVDWIIEDVNKLFERIIGINKSDIIGKQASCFDRIYSLQYLEHFSRVAKTMEPCQFESYYPTIGKYIKHSVFSHQQNHFVVVFEDISDIRIFQLKLEDQNTQLKLKEKALKEANKHKEMFLNTLSHELRTPLTSILGFAMLLSQDKDIKLNTHQLDFFERIITNSNHLAALIDDLLDMSRINRGKIAFNYENLKPCHMVKDIIDSMETQFSGKNIKLVKEIDTSIDPIKMDGKRFKQIIYNLLTNALKFTPEHGRVEVHLKKLGSRSARLMVKDNGIGIPDDEQKKIFEGFYQHASPTNKEGLGIGLALTRQLIQNHGWKLELNSQEGQGSTFIIDIIDK
jgi:PAS domain S-box-containing protein